MPITKGGLEPAMIVNLSTGELVHCMFNPHEFSVSKQNQWTNDEVKGKNVPKVKFSQGGAQNLTLQLFFDTYVEKLDVRMCTRGLWNMMMVTRDMLNQRNNKSEPPRVEFRWGRFSFRAIITQITQRFTLFLPEGTPVRTTVDVSFQQVEDEEDQPGQNPTSGGGPPLKVHTVQAGERLDWIAFKAYGDSTYWRLIADANDLVYPQRLQEGYQLVIPPLE
jgi:hypothetical protein